jgi:hypothetical protein
MALVNIKRFFIGIILFGLIGGALYLIYRYGFIEKYSSIFTIDPNYKPNFKEDTLIIPPFAEDYFKSNKNDYNEYQYNNRQITSKKYPWLKTSFIGQSQLAQDSNNPTQFTSF